MAARETQGEAKETENGGERERERGEERRGIESTRERGKKDRRGWRGYSVWTERWARSLRVAAGSPGGMYLLAGSQLHEAADKSRIPDPVQFYIYRRR